MDCELTLVLQARTYNTNQYHPTHELCDTHLCQVSTATCFGSEVPSSRSLYNKDT